MEGKILLIHISKKQLAQVEYLIGQSVQGNHILFNVEDLRSIFFRDRSIHREWSIEEAYSAEHHIEKLILEPSLAEKKAYLENLDKDTFERVVKTYFNIIENNIYDSMVVQH
jgi:hypothetical protein